MDGGGTLEADLAGIPLSLPIPALSAASLDDYIRSVRQIPALSLSTECALAARLREQQDLQAAARLIMANLRHVVFIALGYQGYGLPLGDLIQEGNIGLMKAVRRYDPARGVRLIAFATHWIKAAIHDYVIMHWRIVKTATTKAQRKLFFKLRSSKSRPGPIHTQEAQQLAVQLGVSVEELIEMDTRLGAEDSSLDAPAPGDAHGVLAETLAGGEDSAAQIEEAQWQTLRLERLRKALQRLDPRARDIIQRRWLCADGERAELQELANHYGVSAERIRQIQNQALLRMREQIGPQFSAPSEHP